MKEVSYDLVFMDIEMPVMDGIAATKAIIEQLGSEAPPIIALTAHSMDGDRERFMEAGMVDYITKPININRLQEILAQFS